MIAAVEALSKREGETFGDAMRRVRANSLARVVKIADIADNTDPEWLQLLPDETRRRLQAKHREALRVLTEDVVNPR